ncbi:MAG: hypothetical protein RI964_2395 [Pseudomonadota bacterium]|jgi:plasmid stability protein
MATLSVRNLPDDVQAALRQRAARAGVSMEAEVRNILIRACTTPAVEREDLATLVKKVQYWTQQLPKMTAAPSKVDEFLAMRKREAAQEW